MWLVYTLITFICWGTADLFYKKSNENGEKYSHLKTSVVVGIVMGVTAVVTMVTKGLEYDFRNLLVYLPVSSMYILSMTIGYFGLKYLMVSISSPIQNASGAVSAILLIIVLRRLPDPWTSVAILLVTAGVIILGIAERRQEVRSISPERENTIGIIAIFIPILYCIIDALGTFFDGWYLDDVATTPLLGVTEETLEDVANVSYQLTFFIVAMMLLVYITVIRKEKFEIPKQKNRLLAALFETGGQLAYVYALSGNGIVAAPIISSYCVASVILGRIVLKEKLEKLQYAAIALVFGGILILGILEGLGA